MMLITIYAIVSSCDDCLRKSGKKSFRNPPAPLAAVTPAPPKDKNLSNLSAPTDSLGSTPSPTPAAPPSSGASGSSSSSSSSSGSDSGYDSSSSSGFSGPSSPSLPTPFAGLPNLGNTCYMNAVLQIIAALYADKVPEGYLKTLIGKINTGSKPLADSDITEFIKGLPAGAKDMATSGKQEDSAQFMKELNDACKFLYTFKRTLYNFVKAETGNDILYKESNKEEEELDHSLVVCLKEEDPSDIQLTDIIASQVSEIFIENGDLAIKSDEYQSINKTPISLMQKNKKKLEPIQDGRSKHYIQQQVISEIPPKLCIQVNRYRLNGAKYEKIERSVHGTFNITINRDPSENIDTALALNGFIVHYGGKTANGHYIAYVKREGKWYEANDSTIQEIPLSEATDKSKTAYLLFYRKE